MENPSVSLKDIGRIYLDHNATTPPLISVVENLSGWVGHWGNPSSIHWSGRGPKNLIRGARAALAEALSCHPLELLFTSGGSEGNNLVIKGVFETQSLNGGRNEYITSQIEHPSVIKSFEYLRSQGAIVHFIPVSREGHLDLEYYRRVLSDKTALVSIMTANNETGSLMPIPKLAQMAHEVGALFHTDAVQALGKMVVNLPSWGVDFATFAAHKVYALKGAGAVFVRKGVRLTSLIAGGAQERSRRAGTENVLAIAAFGHVAKELLPKAQEKSLALCELRDAMESAILKSIPGVSMTGAGVKRLSNTSSLLIDDIDGESLLMSLDMEGVSVSTGAACSSGSPEPSPVLLALGLSRAEAQRSLRVSLGWDTTREEIQQFVATLTSVVERLRTFRALERQNRGEISV
jgi:cysteine desulfurase